MAVELQRPRAERCRGSLPLERRFAVYAEFWRFIFEPSQKELPVLVL
jgi:hypothetical protein